MFQDGSKQGLRTGVVWILAASLLGPSLAGLTASGMTATAFAAENEQLKTALGFKPIQADVEYEIADLTKTSSYKMTVERQGKGSGWVVTNPNGQPLRRFVDSNADNVVDQWRYYQNGIEVYRDLDTNFNSKVDQCRWLNNGGMRWGVDSNEDGKLDQWKQISAEEVSREAVRALTKKDPQILKLILIDSDDLKKLALPAALEKKIQENIADSETKLAKGATPKGTSSKATGANMSWMRFDTPMPCLIPAQQDGLKEDLRVYENAMAIVDLEGKAGFVNLGELIQLGDVWKLARVPALVEGDSMQMADGGLFFTTNSNRETSTEPLVNPESNPEMQKLVDRLQQLDQKAQEGKLDRGEMTKYTLERSEVIEELFNASKTSEEQEQWMRQLVDGVNAAIQSGDYPKGFEKLDSLEKKIQGTSPKSSMLPYIRYRKILGQYTVAVSEADNSKRGSVQEQFMKDLEQFVKSFPESEDTPQAALQLAVTHEFNGKQKEAQQWYTRLVSNHRETPEGKKAEGALTRMDLKGRILELNGAGLDGKPLDLSTYRGQTVAVFFWATWCVPCTDDLPKIRELYEQYHSKGFEIVGVNLDSTPAEVAPYLAQHKVNWPQIHDPGGLESPLAVRYGIATVPTIFLVDKSGKVVNRAATVVDLKSLLENTAK